MLEALTIKNFQKHRHVQITFDPQVTTFIGPSDTGKSAIIRSIMWVANNKPAGLHHVRHGRDVCTVSLTVDGKKVTRRRGKSVNTYSLDGHTLKSFGNDVPEPVTALLSLDKINAQLQNDKAFWFDDTAGEVSRQLNRIVNLEVMDKTMAAVAAMLRQAKAEQLLVKGRVVKARQHKKQTSYAVSAHKDLAHVESLHKQHKQAAEQAAALKELCETARRCKAKAKELLLMLEALKKPYALGQVWEDLHDRRGQLYDVLALVRALVHTKQQPIPDTKHVEGLYHAWRRARQNRIQLRDALRTATEAKDTACQRRRQAAKLKTEYRTLLGSNCPWCGKPLSQ